MSPTPEYRTLHGRLSNNNRMTGILGIGGGTANYENLINKPSINDVTLVGNKNTEDLGLVAPSDLSEVAFSGDYDDLTNKPVIPSKVSDLTNDSGFITMEDMTASNVEYDNTTSGISSDDVQSAIDNIINSYGNAITIQDDTGTGVIRFNSVLNNSLIVYKINITYTQTGTGTPSKTNIRSISGENEIALESASVAALYDFPNTVYGGIFNILTGQFVMTHKMITLTGSASENWLQAANGGFYIGGYFVDAQYRQTDMVSNMYEYGGTVTSSAGVTDDLNFYAQIEKTNTQYSRVWIKDTSFSNVSDLKTFLSNNNLTIVYRLDYNNRAVEQYAPFNPDLTAGSNYVYSSIGTEYIRYINTIRGLLI